MARGSPTRGARRLWQAASVPETPEVHRILKGRQALFRELCHSSPETGVGYEIAHDSQTPSGGQVVVLAKSRRGSFWQVWSMTIPEYCHADLQTSQSQAPDILNLTPEPGARSDPALLVRHCIHPPCTYEMYACCSMCMCIPLSHFCGSPSGHLLSALSRKAPQDKPPVLRPSNAGTRRT